MDQAYGGAQAKPVVRGAGEIAFEFIVATEPDETAFAAFEADSLTFKPAPGEPALQPRDTQPVPMIAPASIVRVDLDRLDELMRIIGELVISRTRLEDQLTELKRTTPPAAWRSLQETSQSMGRQLRDCARA